MPCNESGHIGSALLSKKYRLCFLVCCFVLTAAHRLLCPEEYLLVERKKDIVAATTVNEQMLAQCTIFALWR